MSAPPRPPDSPDDLSAVLSALRPEGADGPPPDWVRLLFRDDDTSSAALLGSVRAEPAAAIPWLVAIVGDDALSMETAVGGGEAPVRAASLLGTLRAEAAIPVLIDAFTRTTSAEDLNDAAFEALLDMEGAIIEPILAARARLPRASDEWCELARVLAYLEVPDARIREALLDTMKEDTPLGAELCGLSEDVALVPDLRAMWDAFGEEGEAGRRRGPLGPYAIGCALRTLDPAWSRADERKLFAYEERAEEAGLLEIDDDFDDDDDDHDPECDDPDCDLHGPSPEDDQEELRAILEDADRLRRPDGSFVAEPETVLEAPVAPLSRPPTPGRNDPCWCGSGKKYKKCHLEADGA